MQRKRLRLACPTWEYLTADLCIQICEWERKRSPWWLRSYITPELSTSRNLEMTSKALPAVYARFSMILMIHSGHGNTFIRKWYLTISRPDKWERAKKPTPMDNQRRKERTKQISSSFETQQGQQRWAYLYKARFKIVKRLIPDAEISYWRGQFAKRENRKNFWQIVKKAQGKKREKPNSHSKR